MQIFFVCVDFQHLSVLIFSKLNISKIWVVYSTKPFENIPLDLKSDDKYFQGFSSSFISSFKLYFLAVPVFSKRLPDEQKHIIIHCKSIPH